MEKSDASPIFIATSEYSSHRVKVTQVTLKGLQMSSSHAHALCASPSAHFSGSFDYWFCGGCAVASRDAAFGQMQSNDTWRDMQWLYRYDPHLQKFSVVRQNRFEGVKGLYRASVIHREDPKRGPELIVFGGLHVTIVHLDEYVSSFFRYSITTEKWTEIIKRDGHFWPIAIAFHHTLYDTFSDRMVVMGGKNPTEGRLRRIYEYDFALEEVWDNQFPKLTAIVVRNSSSMDFRIS